VRSQKSPPCVGYLLLEDSLPTDILYAVTDDGTSVPIIDVTNPAFAVTASDAEIAAMSDQFLQDSSTRPEITPALREALKRSKLGGGLVAAAGGFVSGLHTYLLKLGPDRLGADAEEIDRRIAASFPAFTARLRLQDMARLLADRLSPSLAHWPHRPVLFINIAGGPAADSWNALIDIHAQNPQLLTDRVIVIAVLDLDDRGPAFGMRALKVLTAAGAPLSGLNVRLKLVTYDWSDATRLREAVGELHADQSICAISSEGGLFEYGSDTEIVSNLQQLHGAASAGAFVVGSVTREGGPNRTLNAGNPADRAATRPRTLETFGQLAAQGGWVVEKVLERPFSYNLRLFKAKTRDSPTKTWIGSPQQQSRRIFFHGRNTTSRH
jgi:hypothetical protein